MGISECARCSSKSYSCDDFCNNCCEVGDGGPGICDGCDAMADRSRTKCGKCGRTFCDEHGDNSDVFECCGQVLCGFNEEDGCREGHETKELPCGHSTCDYWEKENEEKCRECAEEKEATTTTVTPGNHLNLNLADISKQDLEMLHKNIEEELKNRRSVDDLIMELKQAYASIDWGSDDWKSKKTSDAVSELESLGSKQYEIKKTILNLNDLDEKWMATIEFTKVLASMILTAEEYAGKLVNGSCGEWCPNTASFIESLWEDIIGDGSCLPSDAAKSCECLYGILGDYDIEFGSILKKVSKPSNKRLKTGQDKAVAIDLTSP
jgi:hypothetical protein